MKTKKRYPCTQTYSAEALVHGVLSVEQSMAVGVHPNSPYRWRAKKEQI
jgi:hypothetical protein